MSNDDVIITATYKDDPSVSITDFNNSKQFVKIYPNPASTNFSIDLTVEESSEINIAIFELSGRRIGESINNMNVNGGQHLLVLPVSNINSGTYLMKIRINNTEYTKLVVIQ